MNRLIGIIRCDCSVLQCTTDAGRNPHTCTRYYDSTIRSTINGASFSRPKLCLFRSTDLRAQHRTDLILYYIQFKIVNQASNHAASILHSLLSVDRCKMNFIAGSEGVDFGVIEMDIGCSDSGVCNEMSAKADVSIYRDTRIAINFSTLPTEYCSSCINSAVNGWPGTVGSWTIDVAIIVHIFIDCLRVVLR